MKCSLPDKLLVCAPLIFLSLQISAETGWLPSSSLFSDILAPLPLNSPTPCCPSGLSAAHATNKKASLAYLGRVQGASTILTVIRQVFINSHIVLGPACSGSWLLLAASYVYGTEPGLSVELQVQTTASLSGQLRVKSTLSTVLSPKATASPPQRFPIALSHFSQDPQVWTYFGEIFLFHFVPSLLWGHPRVYPSLNSHLKQFIHISWPGFTDHNPSYPLRETGLGYP